MWGTLHILASIFLVFLSRLGDLQTTVQDSQCKRRGGTCTALALKQLSLPNNGERRIKIGVKDKHNSNHIHTHDILGVNKWCKLRFEGELCSQYKGLLCPHRIRTECVFQLFFGIEEENDRLASV
eukprot:m.42939 g.42939  ORF g.42939 m.42939 type:complete len:125 (-) comp10538_c0_seq2:859-1233(-)